MGTISKITDSSGETHLIASSCYGTCSTAAGTVAKVATLTSNSGFQLETGVTVFIKFSNTNSASSPTLNVNSTGAKVIKRRGSVDVGKSIEQSWPASAVVPLTYDGTYWQMCCRESSNGTSSSTYAHAEGSSTTASGSASHAEGYYTTASGNYSHAEGYYVTASGNYSHAEGAYTTTSSAYAHAEGEGYNTSYRNSASGVGSHVEGYMTKAEGLGAHSEGCGAAPSGTHTTYDFNLASGKGSHAEGYLTKAEGLGAHSEGCGEIATFTGNVKFVTASGTASHAEGRSTTASGHYSHAEGESTTSSGEGSHAEGYSTTASGHYSHAEGYLTTSGYNSHAEGYSTTASGYYSHAEGYDTESCRKSQHVFGEYNVLDTEGTDETVKGKYVEIVGNGISGRRSNARTLDWEGNEVLAGGLECTNVLAPEISTGSENPGVVKSNAYSVLYQDAGGTAHENSILEASNNGSITLGDTLKTSIVQLIYPLNSVIELPWGQDPNNLFPGTTWVLSGYSDPINLFKQQPVTFEYGSFNSDGSDSNSTTDKGNRVRTENFMFLIAGTYTITTTFATFSDTNYRIQHVLYAYDNTRTVDNDNSQKSWQEGPFTFTLTDDRYVRFGFRYANNSSIAIRSIGYPKLVMGSSVPDITGNGSITQSHKIWRRTA